MPNIQATEMMRDRININIKCLVTQLAVCIVPRVCSVSK